MSQSLRSARGRCSSVAARNSPKTCGKTRGDEIGGSLGKNSANLTPTFVTYREQIEGKYWFTTYARADEYLHFPTGGVRIREVVKYSNYKVSASK